MMLLTIRSAVVKYFATFLFLQSGVQCILLKKCYGNLGCFSLKPPFTSRTRPVSVMPFAPDIIKTQYILYTRQNPEKGQELDARTAEDVKRKWTHFSSYRETKIIVHGFIDNYEYVTWPKVMKDELLIHGDYNTIIVDWHHGNLPPYAQATANTRVVGAQIGVLIKELQNNYDISPDQIHIIGHSLGAHIAGYAGERTEGLGRISGLDPAGPHFSGTHNRVRLDPSDASLVDVIHSDGKKKRDSGISHPVGHMDFYPNKGYDQPGCEKGGFNLISMFVHNGARELMACGHLRPIKFYTESINSKCSFMAISCNDEQDYVRQTNNCLENGTETWASMGFKANENRPSYETHLKYYSDTADAAPFCLYNIKVNIMLANSSKTGDERGTTMVRLHGDQATTDWLQLDKNPFVYQAGETYEKSVWAPKDVGILFSVEFKWDYQSSRRGPFKGRLFGRRKRHILNLHAVGITRQEEGLETRFCTDKTTVESGKIRMLFNPC